MNVKQYGSLHKNLFIKIFLCENYVDLHSKLRKPKSRTYGTKRCVCGARNERYKYLICMRLRKTMAILWVINLMIPSLGRFYDSCDVAEVDLGFRSKNASLSWLRWWYKLNVWTRCNSHKYMIYCPLKWTISPLHINVEMK